MGLIVKSLHYNHPDNVPLFSDLNFILNDGEKAALVGINGAGKSSLLKLLAGKLPSAPGDITTTETPWYVPQHLGEYDTWTVAMALGVDKKLLALQAILGGDTGLHHFTVLDEDWDIENTVRKVLEKWGVGSISENRLLGSLSGGQKTRVFLAAMELNSQRLILLDEPSNHLDAHTRRQLYTLIQQSKSTMLIVSHDRTLLNLMHKIVELSDKGIETFGGNFDFYQQKKLEKVSALRARLNEQSKALKLYERKANDMAGHRAQQESAGRAVGMSNSIPRIIAGGLKNKAERSTARMMNAHEEKIEHLLIEIEKTKAQISVYETLKIHIPSPTPQPGKVLVDFIDVNFSYHEHPLWNKLSFQVKYGDRVQILGENGIGKTTLLQLITHQLQPTTGTNNSPAFSYYYLDQAYAIIDPTLTVFEQIQAHNGKRLDEEELQQLLVDAQFSPNFFDRKCAGLSGGEKMKLSLSCLLASGHAPDILILDEPTNNLDIQSLAVLTLAVKNFEGTLLVISHDDYFIDEIGIQQTIHLS
ncbi:ABC-F family ATP-binding cassette domain-containing protein [Chitinophaga skermanii]|uniref:ABC-F family ATP-binding cassette domain-containing protein n=1 Tax=Chitinophaga skermanii TaxID=331697 RepID=UPI000DBA040D|nr:ABC-F family ATP-binding cassette domain-containing protein [Chitinophaga skermanii]